MFEAKCQNSDLRGGLLRNGMIAFVVFALLLPNAKSETMADELMNVANAEALLELAPLAAKALIVTRNAKIRQEKHAFELAKRGVAELPAESDHCYKIETGALRGLMFSEWGEIYVDRRFVTENEMKVIRSVEKWIAKWFPDKTVRKRQRRHSAGRSGLPVFRGFEADRYQQHDALIAKFTAQFNADKARWCGGNARQAANIPDLQPALVKAHMIEESGGNGRSSLAAWRVDPLQVNVPGDWGEEKRMVGLSKPSKRNEGSLENNVRAAIMYLARKGFSAAATPAAKRPNGYFDGWKKALQRYNGRRDRTATNRYYSDEYADKIVKRAKNPDLFVPIEIKVKKNTVRKGR